MSNDKNIITLTDGLEFVASLHQDEAHNARTGTLTPQARKDAGIMAEAFASAWAHINRALHPRVPGDVEMIDGDIISLSKQQLNELIVKMVQAGMQNDDIVHLRIDRGHLEAFTVNPRMEDGGRELYRSPSVLLPALDDGDKKEAK